MPQEELRKKKGSGKDDNTDESKSTGLAARESRHLSYERLLEDDNDSEAGDVAPGAGAGAGAANGRAKASAYLRDDAEVRFSWGQWVAEEYSVRSEIQRVLLCIAVSKETVISLGSRGAEEYGGCCAVHDTHCHALWYRKRLI